MRIAILGSGSSGNVALVEAGAAVGARPTRVLIDAGLSKRTFLRRLHDSGVALGDVDAVLITHEHADHFGCAADLGRPLYATASTRRRREVEAARVLGGERFTVGALEVLPVTLPHDADETVGYVLSDGVHRVGVLTDCGAPEERVALAYADCDVLVLEANHDPHLLRLGPYPPSLQRRVRGPRGHLSNAESATLLKMILCHGRAPVLVVAAHLSTRNNRPDLVDKALRPLLPVGTALWIATPGGAPEIRLPLAHRPRQLSLFSQTRAGSARWGAPERLCREGGGTAALLCAVRRGIPAGAGGRSPKR